MNNTKELKPITRKSFYGKAVMITQGDKISLISYSTIVATYNKATKKANVRGWYSKTTARHINAFLNHFGLSTMTKKEMEL